MATLILEDGARYAGTLFGCKKMVTGEVVFSTGMSGYQEAMTDPAYAGQIVCMTYPLIGNVGINDLDFESDSVKMRAMVVSELCELPSNWQLKTTLDEYMEAQGVVGLYGVDTRALTRHIREHGVMCGRIVEGDATDADVEACKAYTPECEAMDVTCKEAYDVSAEGDVSIAVLDLGMKKSLTNWLVKRGAKVRVFPAGTDAKAILDGGFDGVLVSPGPGNPAEIPQVVENVKALMVAMPTMGVGLGHLTMAMASGCQVKRMHVGHHGGNQPVKDLSRGTCSVTGQNHLYVVSGENLPQGVTVSHINWNDRSVEGLRYEAKHAFSVQFIPAGLGGPFDTTYLFDNFLDMVRGNKAQ